MALEFARPFIPPAPSWVLTLVLGSGIAPGVALAQNSAFSTIRVSATVVPAVTVRADTLSLQGAPLLTNEIPGQREPTIHRASDPTLGVDRFRPATASAASAAPDALTRMRFDRGGTANGPRLTVEYVVN